MFTLLLIIAYILYPLLLTSLTVINFDEYGEKYIRTRLGSPNSCKTYQMSLPMNEYIYILGSPSANYRLIHLNTNYTFEVQIDSQARSYLLLNPENTQPLCGEYKRNECIFNLIVTNTGSLTPSIWIKFNKNAVVQSKKTYSDSIKLTKRRRYGMKITDSDLPVFVKLTPNQHHQKMDIDLYAYSEKQFTSYYFPNKAERNHINNIPEQILITSVDKYYENGEWNFFEVYGSTDSDYDNMDYKLQVTKNYVSNNLLKQILLIFAFTIAISFVLGITISFILSFRHQILYFLRIRSTPHRNGASKRQIKKLKIIKYKTNMTNTDQLIDTDHTQCIICLDDYTNDDKIRILRCGHNFHVHCSDEWLFLNNKCPLCYQNIVSAQDMHNMDAIDNNIVRAESVEANDVQDE